MKNKFLKSALCTLLALVLLFSCISCGKNEEESRLKTPDGIAVKDADSLMESGGLSLPMGVYKLMLSIQKGNMAYFINLHYGSHDSAAFWDTIIKSPLTTADQYYTEAIENKAKSLLASALLFEELGLSLPSSVTSQIDSEMEALVNEFGAGKKSVLENTLKEYGFTYDNIKSYKHLAAMSEYASNSLYGSDASKIGSDIKQKYLEDNYFAYRQIFLSNQYLVYKTDGNGDIIYYDGNGNVAYDVINGSPKVGSDGKFVYYTEDGKIAYDTKSGLPSPVYDEDGYQKTEEYSYEQILKRIELAGELMELGAGSEEMFESLVSAYGEDGISQKITTYVAGNISYSSMGDSQSYEFLDAVVLKLAEMEVGELTLIQDESGLHIIRKYALEEGAYANKNYSGWFVDKTYGVYDFNENLKYDLFNEALEPYREKIEVNEELLASETLKTAKPNYYYH